MKRILLTATFFLIPCIALAQPSSAEDVLQANIVASGGADAWSEINSMITTGTREISMPMGDMSGTFERLQQFPGQARTISVTQSPMGQMRQEVLETPAGAWTLARGNWSPRDDASPVEVHGAKTELAILNLEGIDLKDLEAGERDGEPVWVVAYSYGGVEYTRQYRQSDHQLLASSRGDNWSTYEDYREIGGVMIPHKVSADATARVMRGGGEPEEIRIKVVSIVETVSLNAEIPPSTFTKDAGISE